MGNNDIVFQSSDKSSEVDVFCDASGENLTYSESSDDKFTLLLSAFQKLDEKFDILLKSHNDVKEEIQTLKQSCVCGDRRDTNAEARPKRVTRASSKAAKCIPPTPSPTPPPSSLPTAESDQPSTSTVTGDLTPSPPQMNLKEKVDNFIMINSSSWKDVSEKILYHYGKSIRSKGIADIYKEFLNEPTPYIPKKFRENPYPGESSNQSERRKRLEKTKLELEVERLEEDSARRNSIIDECEVKIKSIITQCESVEIRQGLFSKWIEDTERRKRECKKNWQQNKSFFERKDSDDSWRTVGQTSNNHNPYNRENNGNYNNQKRFNYRNNSYFSNHNFNNWSHQHGNNNFNDYPRNYNNSNNYHSQNSSFLPTRKWRHPRNRRF